MSKYDARLHLLSCWFEIGRIGCYHKIVRKLEQPVLVESKPTAHSLNELRVIVGTDGCKKSPSFSGICIECSRARER